MLDLVAPLRWARVEDARALAELIDFAGDGLPRALWEQSRALSQSAVALYAE